MKRKILSFTLSLILFVMLIACSGETDNVTFNLQVYGATVESKVVPLNNTSNCFDLLKLNFRVVHETNESDTCITEINDLKVLDSSYYIEFSVNGVKSQVGVSSVTAVPSDVYDFNLTTKKSNKDIRVDNLVYGYLGNGIKKTLDGSANKSDIDSLALVVLLNKNGYDVVLEDYLTREQATLYYDSATSSYLERILVKKYYDTSIEDEITSLEAEEMSDSWSCINNLAALICAKPTSSVIDDYLIVLDTNQDYLDYYGMCLYAVSGASNTLVNKFIEHIEEHISTNGFSELNANTLAMLIIGLVANNVDINEIKKDDTSLLDALLSYEMEYEFTYNGEKNDFATKQAYAALTAYKVWNDKAVKQGVNLYR